MGRDPKALGVLFAKQVIRATERAMERAVVAAHEDLKRVSTHWPPLRPLLHSSEYPGPCGQLLSTLLSVSVSTNLRAWPSSRRDSRGQVSHRHSASSWGYSRFWCYNYFRGRLELFDLDMKGESVILLNLLTLRLSTARPVSRVDPLNPSVLHDRRFRRRSSSAAIALL